jgi:hypothetical protein
VKQTKNATTKQPTENNPKTKHNKTHKQKKVAPKKTTTTQINQTQHPNSTFNYLNYCKPYPLKPKLINSTSSTTLNLQRHR